MSLGSGIAVLGIWAAAAAITFAAPAAGSLPALFAMMATYACVCGS